MLKKWLGSERICCKGAAKFSRARAKTADLQAWSPGGPPAYKTGALPTELLRRDRRRGARRPLLNCNGVGFRERSLNKGVNPFLYWTLRALFVPFFLIYFRMQRIGREHLPQRARCCWPPTTAASWTRS